LDQFESLKSDGVGLGGGLWESEAGIQTLRTPHQLRKKVRWWRVVKEERELDESGEKKKDWINEKEDKEEGVKEGWERRWSGGRGRREGKEGEEE
jgi:hypothetical protein